jgi:hypothetical protein
METTEPALIDDETWGELISPYVRHTRRLRGVEGSARAG